MRVSKSCQLIGVSALLILLSVTPQARAQHVFKVMVAEATLKDLPATTRLVGTTRPRRRSVIGSEVAGPVEALPARQGDFLQKGDLICQLDDDTPRLELQAASRKLESLQSAIAIAKADFELWSFEKKRMERLIKEDRANLKEIKESQAKYLMALNAVQEAEQNFAEQEALVELKTADLAKTRITAPFAGFITRLETEVGQWVQRGGDVVEILDLESVLVRVNVPESIIAFVIVGDSASIKLDALEDTLTGEIKYVIPQADERARTFPVDIEIANPDHKLRSGLFARVTIKSGPAKQALAVPRDAVVQIRGVDTVWMVQQKGADGAMSMPINVTLGAEIGDWVAVTSENIEPGTKIVVRGNERLMPFPMPVEVVDEPALVRGSTAGQDTAAETN